jgi:hypothetical protein
VRWIDIPRNAFVGRSSLHVNSWCRARIIVTLVPETKGRYARWTKTKLSAFVILTCLLDLWSSSEREIQHNSTADLAGSTFKSCEIPVRKQAHLNVLTSNRIVNGIFRSLSYLVNINDNMPLISCTQLSQFLQLHSKTRELYVNVSDNKQREYCSSRRKRHILCAHARAVNYRYVPDCDDQLNPWRKVSRCRKLGQWHSC